ncbi:MAG: nitroreductase [Firmicutes bacterium HGW-Firmicutes-13]|nr:MAG: nitroreductase [Firmicutes bacterium HGW-Firmicutes-13]
MELAEAIKKRRSIRYFKNEDIPEEMISQILEAACLAPTAGNVQTWKFVVVKDIDVKKDLAVSSLNQLWISKAPVIVVVCADLNRAERIYGERGRNLYAVQDTAASIQNILLTAVSLGLGACWIGAFNEHRVSKILDLSPGIRPLALIPIGYPNEEPQTPSRFKWEEVTRYIKQQEVK